MNLTFPVYLYLGDLQIHPHFLFEMIAYVIAFRLLLWKNTRKDNITSSQRTSVIVGGMVGALLGAKVLVLLQHLNLLWQDWRLYILLLFQGKTIVGALLGGLIGVEVTKKFIGVKKSTGDVFVYPLMTAMGIGRIGCFLTGLSDRTYGIATSLPWGVDFGDGILRHPTQIYEIFFLISWGILLHFRSKYQQQEGDLFKFFMVGYLSFRFLVDFLKPDFPLIFGLSAIQLACLVALIYYRRSITNLFKFSSHI